MSNAKHITTDNVNGTNHLTGWKRGLLVHALVRYAWAFRQESHLFHEEPDDLESVADVACELGVLREFCDGWRSLLDERHSALIAELHEDGAADHRLGLAVAQHGGCGSDRI